MVARLPDHTHPTPHAPPPTPTPQKSRTPRFVHAFANFLALYIVSAGPGAVVASTDAVQPGIFSMLAQQVWARGGGGGEGPGLLSRAREGGNG